MSFDILSAYDTQTPSQLGVAVVINDPATGKPGLLSDGSEASITLLGPDCPDYRRQMSAAQRRAAELGRKAIGGTVDAQDTFENNNQLLADITIAWNLEIGGSRPAFTKQAAKDLYLVAPAIGDLLFTRMGNRSDFLASPSVPSQNSTPPQSEQPAGSSS